MTIHPIRADEARQLLQQNGGVSPTLIDEANQLILRDLRALPQGDPQAEGFSHTSTLNYREFMLTHRQVPQLWNQPHWDEESKRLVKQLARVYSRAGWTVKPNTEDSLLVFFLPREAPKQPSED